MEIKQIKFENLKLAEIEAFIPESKRSCLKTRENQDLHLILLAAFEKEKLIGLLVASATKTYYIAELHSLFIDEKWRRKSVGTALLTAFESLLTEKKCKSATLLYEENLPAKEALKGLLEKKGWAIPVPIIYRYVFDGASFKPDWIFKPYALPPSFKLFFWKDLKNQEKELLLKREEEGNILGEISPFLNEESIEPLNSLGLKTQTGEIIGWMITHRINPSTIKYSGLYLERDFRHRLNPVQLLIESIKIQKDFIKNNHPAKIAVFDLNLNQTSSNWHHFIEKRLKPYAQEVIPICMSWKGF
ncbi:MAG TPA: GNAT family N-acetyltransferase [Parachlamydiaceae bacterium]|nr:GNAT family N-acetyltransferase [Parachlamydiaceae bacterium]